MQRGGVTRLRKRGLQVQRGLRVLLLIKCNIGGSWRVNTWGAARRYVEVRGSHVPYGQVEIVGAQCSGIEAL